MPLALTSSGSMVGLVTQTMHQTDQEIRANVTEELRYDPSCRAGPVEVTTNGGSVKLSGEVTNLRERIAAKRSAMRVRGVTSVSDEMTVRASSAIDDATDADIAQAARHILDWTADVPARTVTADVLDHKVTLSGTVAWDYQRD